MMPSASHRAVAPPIRIDGGDPLGRVDVVFVDDDSVIVSWLESVGEEAEIRVRRIHVAGQPEQPITVMPTRSSRASGFPRMARLDGAVMLSWTDAVDPSRVRTVLLEL